MCRIAGMGLLLAVMLARYAPAQQGVGPMIEAVFEQTKTAKSEADFNAIINQCVALRNRTEDPSRTEYLTKLLSWALNKRGEVYSKRAATTEDLIFARELDEIALRDFEAAVSNDPQRWRAVHNRGVSYALAGKHEEAEADFQRTMEINPKYANAWFNRAEIRYETGRYREALADYSETLQRAPMDSGALRGRGLCRYNLGDYQAAIGDFSSALQKAPTAELHIFRGQSWQAQAQWDKAAEDFRQAVAVDRASPKAYCAAAWLMAVCPNPRFRNEQLAVEAALQAASLEREQAGAESSRTLDTLAAAMANQGEMLKAAEYAQQALQRGNQLDRATREQIQQRLRRYQQGQPYRIASVVTDDVR